MKLLITLFAAGGMLSAASSLPVYRDSLDNGLIVLTYEDHRVPAVSLRLVSRSGAALDPAGRSGTANLTAQLLLDGTADRSAEAITETIEFLGMRREAGSGYDFSYSGLLTLSEYLDTALVLLAEAARSASFPDAEFERERALSLTRARRSWDRPNTVVEAEFDRLLFGNHPYTRPSWGDTADLTGLGPADARAFHATHWQPGNCFLIVVGAVEREDLLGRVSNLLGDWPASVRVERPTAPGFDFPPGIRTRAVTRPEMNQSYVVMGHPGLSMFDADLQAARLMSFVLGGSAIASRLGESVRVEGGLAYDVRCWFDRLALPGAFRATVQTSDPAEAIRRMRREIRLMYDSGPTESETENARNYFTGSFPLSYSSTSGKLGVLTFAEAYGLGPGWLEEFPRVVAGLTRQDLAAAARNRLRPEDMLIVVLGPLTGDRLGLDDTDWLEE